MDSFRKEIDNINQDILKLLARRCDVSKEIAKYKLKMNLPVLDESREKIVLDDVAKHAKALHMDPIAVKKIFIEIMNLSKGIQKRIIS